MKQHKSIWRQIDEFDPAPYNPRQISAEALAALGESLDEFGLVQPLIVNIRSAEKGWDVLHRRPTLVGGHQRLKVLKRRGEKRFRVVEVDLDAIREKALNLALNHRGMQGGFTPDAMALVEEICIEDVDLFDRMVFIDLEVPPMPPEVGTTEKVPSGGGSNKIPAVVPAITKPGEKVRLGNHMLHCCDCVEFMQEMPSNSVDACVTDPPYGIGFLGAKWDSALPGVHFATQLFRVLKPGAHAILFAANRTIHRLAVLLEDAGFEVRDQIGWLTYQGLPKSHDVSKAIDRQRDDRDDILRVTAWIRSERDRSGLKNSDIDAPFGFSGMAGHWTSSKSQPSVPTLQQIPQLLELFGLTLDGVPDEMRTLIWTLNGRKGQPGDAWFRREITGYHEGPSPIGSYADKFKDSHHVAKERRDNPASPEARQWEGWGTALKPATEPAIVVRKPLEGTVAESVLKWGTGGLNINACRYALGDVAWPGPSDETWSDLGRWPANIYYCPKPAPAERERGAENLQSHPTVKPVRLMNWLLRLVTPPGGLVLEPFLGSGSTLIASDGLDLKMIGIEREPMYCDIIRARFDALD